MFLLIFIFLFSSFTLNSKDLSNYFVGWYLNDDIKISRSFLGLSEEKNEYFEYYDIFFQYGLYNREKDFLSADIFKFQPLIKFAHSKKMIIDLPRYSTFSRNLFFLFNVDSTKNNILEISDLYLLKKNKKILIDSDSVNKYLTAFWDKNEPSYGVIKIKNLKKDERIVIQIKKEKIFDERFNSVVYSYFDIFGFSYKLLGKNSSLSFIFEFKNSHSSFYFILSKSLKEKLDLKYKNFIRTDFNLTGYKSDMFKIQKNDTNRFKLNIPVENTLDTVWQTFQINLRERLKTLLKSKDYKLVNLKIVIKNTYLGNINFSYTNEKKIEITKNLIDIFSKSFDDRIIGFYLEDEIEAKRILNLDRWFFDYRKDIYLKNSLKKEKEKLDTFIFEISNYIKGKGLIPFILHSAQFYDYKENQKLKMMMFDDTGQLLLSEYIMFDDYTYDYFFSKRFKIINDFAKANGKKILYVGDAYQKNSFEMVRWRFFTPLILGASGALFYAYYYPYNDFNRETIGSFTKFLKINSLDSLKNSIEFTYQDKEGEKFSKLFIFKDKIYLLYFYNSNFESYPKKLNPDMFLKEIKILKDKIGLKTFSLYDLTPYSLNDLKEGKVRLLSFEKIDLTKFMETLESKGFLKIENLFDIRILMLKFNKE